MIFELYGASTDTHHQTFIVFVLFHVQFFATKQILVVLDVYDWKFHVQSLTVEQDFLINFVCLSGLEFDWNVLE